MKTNLNTLYRVIKSLAQDRDSCYSRFLVSNPGEADKVWNLQNHMVRNCVMEYFENGGKRPVGQYLAEDK